jgi:hypothetical protein
MLSFHPIFPNIITTAILRKEHKLLISVSQPPTRATDAVLYSFIEHTKLVTQSVTVTHPVRPPWTRHQFVPEGATEQTTNTNRRIPITLSGFETAVTDLWLRPHGHRDRYTVSFILSSFSPSFLISCHLTREINHNFLFSNTAACMYKVRSSHGYDGCKSRPWRWRHYIFLTRRQISTRPQHGQNTSSNLHNLRHFLGMTDQLSRLYKN